MQFDALNLYSRVKNDGLLGALNYIKPTDVTNERLRQEWAAMGTLGEPILTALTALSRLMKERPASPGVTELKARAKGEGSLWYLLVYYGFDASILGDPDIRREAETIETYATAFRVAEHHFMVTLQAAAEGQRRINKAG